jgi:4-amino-4-deoxy-L-arabinose transferase-like glycosyltransferase
MGEQARGRSAAGAWIRTHARFWRSPKEQPRWARPALLAVTALATLAYAWGMSGAALEAFYGAAARSMSMSWHNFFFGAFDPRATVSVDKLPGSLWPQALSLRIFGFHIWAVVLPQVLEGALTILVLYRALRRLCGPLAGIVAATVIAASPVTVALNRGNVADSLLILLLVLAADATTKALTNGRLRPLLMAGVWVGLAFQTKMTVAWLVLPALAGAYLLAAPVALRSRLGHLGAAAAVTALVSVSWMAVVSVVPASHRPYVDGTQNNSVFSQTFEYNGLSRLKHGDGVYGGAGHPAEFLVQQSQSTANPVHRSGPSWHRLLSGPFGRDDGWLAPAAAIAAAILLFARRKATRLDPARASIVLWGLWLVVMAAFFSAGGYPNSYYVAALMPAIGALCGAGVAWAWRERELRRVGVGLAGTILVCIAYGVYLLRGGTAVPGWLVPTAIILGIVGVSGLLVPRIAALLRISKPVGVAMALASSLLLPGTASALMVIRGLGPFAAPYEPTSATVSRASSRRTAESDREAVEQLDSTYDTTIPLVTDSSILAAPFILATGREILPIGGFQGGIPSPTLNRLRRYIAAGEVRAFLVPSVSSDPRIVWIRANCKSSEPSGSAEQSPTALYDCGAG